MPDRSSPRTIVKSKLNGADNPLILLVRTWRPSSDAPLPVRAEIAYIRPMSQNPPILRPDLARPLVPDIRRPGQPTIGMVSLGCPKALVDTFCCKNNHSETKANCHYKSTFI